MRDESTDSKPDEDGAALVEFAILVPLLVMLLFGIVSAALAFNHSLSLAHSAREAARQAATLPVTNFVSPPPSLEAWLTAVADQAVDDAEGSLDPGVAGRSICIAYVHPNGTLPTDVTKSLTRDASGDNFASAPCFDDGRPNGDERRVQVRVEREVDFNVILWSTTLTIDSEGVSRYEAAFGV